MVSLEKVVLGASAVGMAGIAANQLNPPSKTGAKSTLNALDAKTSFKGAIGPIQGQPTVMGPSGAIGPLSGGHPITDRRDPGPTGATGPISGGKPITDR